MIRTRYARCTRLQAALAFAGLLAAIDWCALQGERSEYTLQTSNLEYFFSDGALYASVAGHVHAGEDYYHAAARELASRGYPVHSVFNWRTPVYAWIFGKPPSPLWGRTLLGTLAVVSCYAVARRAGGKTRLAAAAGLAGSYGWLLHPYPPYFMELWSGLTIAISACCIGLGRWDWGVLAAVAALVLRELALPYVVLAFLLALRQRRWRAVAALALATTSFLLVYGEHYSCVLRHASVPVSSRPWEWICLGGTPFVLATCRTNFLVAALPTWCTAMYLPLSMLGLLGWEGGEATPIRLTAIIYLFIFALAGNPYNFYWGWLCVPLLFLGFLRSPLALRDLLDALSK